MATQAPSIVTDDLAPPLRLWMDEARRPHNAIDGAWWPHSRELSVELAALIGGVEEWLDGGRVARVVVNLASWTSVPAYLDLGGRRITLSWFGALDAHTITVDCVDGRQTELLVIPPETAPAAASAALAMAISATNTNRGAAILAAVVPELLRDVDTSRAWHQPMPSAAPEWASGNGTVGF